MALQILSENDGSLAPLQGKTVGVLGFGSQGHAHAMNARDSGVNVIVAQREGSENHRLAVEAGFKPASVADVVKQADMLLVALPDEVQPTIWSEQIEPNLRDGQTVCFTHGFNIHYKTIQPPAGVNVIMCAPKGPGHVVRSEYERGGGVPCLIAVQQDPSGNAQDLAMAWAIAIGGARSGVIVTTFKDEVETDLFGEQCVLCGGLSELIKTGFEVLTDAGYPEEMAYYEVCHELKLIIDLIERGGLNYMRYSVSNTAEFGDYHTGPKVINQAARDAMKAALADIQSGKFAKTFRDDYEAGFPWFKAAREKDRTHPVEQVGKRLRKMMPWLKAVER